MEINVFSWPQIVNHKESEFSILVKWMWDDRAQVILYTEWNRPWPLDGGWTKLLNACVKMVFYTGWWPYLILSQKCHEWAIWEGLGQPVLCYIDCTLNVSGCRRLLKARHLEMYIWWLILIWIWYSAMKQLLLRFLCDSRKKKKLLLDQKNQMHVLVRSNWR